MRGQWQFMWVSLLASFSLVNLHQCCKGSKPSHMVCCCIPRFQPSVTGAVHPAYIYIYMLYSGMHQRQCLKGPTVHCPRSTANSLLSDKKFYKAEHTSLQWRHLAYKLYLCRKQWHVRHCHHFKALQLSRGQTEHPCTPSWQTQLS